MKNYKALSKFQKLEFIQDSGVTGFHDRHAMAVYLKALWLNDIDYIQLFESFGERPHKMLMNKRAFERQKLFGFEKFELDENGWLVKPELLEKERISFKVKNENHCSNSVTIGKGLNGKWTFDFSYSTGNCGTHCTASIWGKIVDTKEEAIINGLIGLIEGHKQQRERLFQKDTCGNYKESYSKEIVRLAQNELDIRTGKKPVQLSFF